MIKQRNANILNKNNLNFNNNKQQQSPFNRQNPYRVKAQFYSQRKKTSSLTSATTDSKERKASRQSNPQSLLYRRDYKQNPPTMYISEYRKMNDNFIQVKNNMLMRNLSRNGGGVNEQLQEQEYRLRLKQYVADKFCPSDPYLEIVKDKFVYVSSSNTNSEFQNVMKMSNLGISNLVTRNNNYNSVNSSGRSGVSYKERMNPFYRKSLISSLGNSNYNYRDQQYNSYNGNGNSNKWEYFPQLSTAGDNINNNNYSSVSNYPFNIVNVGLSSSSHYQQMASNVYHVSIPSTDPSRYYNHNNHMKTSTYSQHQLSQSQSRVSNNNNYNNINNNSNYNNINDNSVSPKSSLAASFGPDYQWKVNGMIKPYIDAVIENHLQDPLNIQAKAPREIKIKGKTFYVNRVNRFM